VPGKTGFAHLFEHVMFQGSRNVGKAEHIALIQAAGGTTNGTTWLDRTNYFETVPSHQLELALWLEADRMGTLLDALSQENLGNQREVVKNEKRYSYDNRPYGTWSEKLQGHLYPPEHPYHHPTIGSMADLDAASIEDVSAFFRTYYAPNNAVLSIVGDVNTKDALEKARKYFERIPSQPAPAPVDIREPAQTEERRDAIEDPLARLPRVDIAWHTPPANTPDDDALTILTSVLTSGRSSRMYESLVRQKQLTSNVSAFSDGARGPNLFRVISTALPGKAIAEVEAAIHAEIEKLKAGPIADWEMEKALNAQRRAYVASLGSSLQRAVLLGQYALFWNDPNLINTYLDRIGKVTAADVQRVAKQYLTQANRTVVVTTPKAVAVAGAGGAR
jgi:predicted Zn-dependent peptidase